MITREMIQNGFDNGSISIEDEFGGCISLCCRIADNAFYFAGMEDGDSLEYRYSEIEINRIVVTGSWLVHAL